MYATQREKQVFSQLCEGYSSKEIASKLFIFHYTIETHKRNLIMKLNAHNSVHLAILAEKRGLLNKNLSIDCIL